jgi:hypothetical protein
MSISPAFNVQGSTFKVWRLDVGLRAWRVILSSGSREPGTWNLEPGTRNKGVPA